MNFFNIKSIINDDIGKRNIAILFENVKNFDLFFNILKKEKFKIKNSTYIAKRNAFKKYDKIWIYIYKYKNIDFLLFGHDNYNIINNPISEYENRNYKIYIFKNILIKEKLKKIYEY